MAKEKKEFTKESSGAGSPTDFHTSRRFPDRGGKDWIGPIVDYKEVDLLRKFLTTSSKLMSRRRGGTNTQEQKALKLAIKRARYLGLVPYTGS